MDTFRSEMACSEFIQSRAVAVAAVVVVTSSKYMYSIALLYTMYIRMYGHPVQSGAPKIGHQY